MVHGAVQGEHSSQPGEPEAVHLQAKGPQKSTLRGGKSIQKLF